MTPQKTIFFYLLCLVLLASGCNVRTEEAVVTSTAVVVTSTLPPSPTLAPSETPLPTPAQPAIVPVEGTSSTQINVRSEPSTVGNVLGIIPANTKVEIIAKDLAGNWWQIKYPQGVDGKGWVTAQYVTTIVTPDIPVAGGNAVDPNSGNVAVARQQINIRSGPGTSFNSLGTLNPQDVVSLTGKDANGAWLQIAFSAGPEGKGWVNAAFVQARGVENLPIITELGEVVGTGTPTGIPPTAMPTVVPAWADNDSMNNPVVSVMFEPASTRSFAYTGDVSSPEGDAQDWINFVPYGQTIVLSIECTGSSEIQAQLLVNGLTVQSDLQCGDRMKQIMVNAGSNYTLHVEIPAAASQLVYTGYTVTVQSSQ